MFQISLGELSVKAPNLIYEIDNSTILANADENITKVELSKIIVLFLNPYYEHNVFKSRELFKFMAREIVHKLLTYPVLPGKLK